MTWDTSAHDLKSLYLHESGPSGSGEGAFPGGGRSGCTSFIVVDTLRPSPVTPGFSPSMPSVARQKIGFWSEPAFSRRSSITMLGAALVVPPDVTGQGGVLAGEGVSEVDDVAHPQVLGLQDRRSSTSSRAWASRLLSLAAGL